MQSRSLISVVIPTFNRAGQVAEALKSVLAQTHSEFEVIVVDDGSTDATGEIVQQLISRQGDRGTPIRYFFQPNQGQSAARNKGIEEARGEWIAFLDSDDVWLPEKLESQVQAIQHFNAKCQACVTDAQLVDGLEMDTTAFRVGGWRGEGTLGLAADAAASLAKTRDPFWVSTLLVRADVIRQVGRFDPDLRYAEDHDFLFRMALATSICYVNQPLSKIDRSRSPQGSSCRPWDEVEVRLRGSQAMFEKWLSMDSKLPPSIRKTIVQNLREINSAWTNWYLEHERYEDARQAVSKAMDYQLTSKLAFKWTLIRVAPRFARRFVPKMRVSKMRVY